ncbi:hypothetical protein CHITON_0974 [Thermococcus chitonophagus]|uniref:Uncharacterized protein n=1 Tax=Thermococcus chitonophagus TaxID=54262 RepID=A0A160VRV3_9EURY|nr:hypothetical protein CHITON_0974 [Thermococcus chitonophagus]
MPREEWKKLKKLDVETILRENIGNVEETLLAEYEEFLLSKKAKLEEKLQEIEKDLERLRKFYEKALKDKELMMKERDRLRRENKELTEKLRLKRSRG